MTLPLCNPFIDICGNLPNPSADTATAAPGSASNAVAEYSCAGANSFPCEASSPHGTSADTFTNSPRSSAFVSADNLFDFVRLLCAQARIYPRSISPEALAVCEEIIAYERVHYDPPPLFLRGAA